MEEILSIQTPVTFDESVAHYEVHAHQPYTASFNNSDEIRISIQHQDLCLLPSRSALHICGRLVKGNNTPVENTKLVNNAICHLFEEIRYELNAIEIDKCKNVGLTTLMKGLVSYNPTQSFIIENAGWIDVEETQKIINDDGYFDVTIPLSLIFGFAEDYRKIVVNAKHELVLMRSRNNINAVEQTAIRADNVEGYENFNIELTRIEWLMPYVVASNSNKIRLLDFVGKDRPIVMSFRTWELYEYPLLPITSRQVWTVKTSNQLEKPRFVILGFQTNRKDRRAANASRFDHCNLTNVKLFLNSQSYPYGNLNLDVNRNQFAMLYDMYANFQNSYYSKDSEPMLKKSQYLTYAPLIVIDCSKQNESLKSAPVDIRLEFEAKENFPAGTSAYCLILHDRIVQYSPVSGDVQKL